MQRKCKRLGTFLIFTRKFKKVIIAFAVKSQNRDCIDEFPRRDQRERERNSKQENIKKVPRRVWHEVPL